MSETEAKLNKKMRKDLCALLGISVAMSNDEIVEHVEVLYKPFQDLAAREKAVNLAEIKLKELNELQKSKVHLIFEPGYFSLLCDQLKWSYNFVGYHGDLGKRLYTEVMRQTGVNVLWEEDQPKAKAVTPSAPPPKKWWQRLL